MTKKFAAGVVTLLSVVALAACGKSTTTDDKIVTMKGDTITVADFYEQAKNSPAAQESVLTLVLSKVFEEQYGDKVSDEKVSKQYNKSAEAYGDSFESVLRAQGMTADAYKQQIRLTMLIEYAVKKAAQTELTTENYQAAYNDYTPEVSAEVIQLDTEEKANEVLAQVKAEGADFAAIAKEKTTATEAKTAYSFDSAATVLPTDVQKAAFALEQGAISDLIKVTDSSGYTSYYIVKLTQKSEKNADWKAYKSQLKKIIINGKITDITYQNAVIGAVLEKANVKIKDQAFSTILANYATTETNDSNK